MVNVIAVGIDGKIHSLGTPVSLVLSRDADIPADSLSVAFDRVIEDELADLRVYRGDVCIFEGLADEQTLYAGESAGTRIEARSTVALLLDNEAQPAVFHNVTAELLVRYYAEHLGFEASIADTRFLEGEYKVEKGCSCFRALNTFCTEVYGVPLRVQGMKLCFGGTTQFPQLTFANNGAALPFTDMHLSLRRSKLISCVRAKTESAEGYDTSVESRLAKDRGVRRERFINATVYSATPLSSAYTILRNADKRFRVCTLESPCCLADKLFSPSSVQAEGMGKVQGFYVSALRYTLSRNGESTRLTLSEKGDLICGF